MLRMHFLNVGKGSSTIIEFPTDRVGMVDIDDSQSIGEDQLAAVAEMMGTDALLRYAIFKSLDQPTKARNWVEREYDIQLTDPIQYLSGLGISNLFRFILTHPDMDHMSGLDRLYRDLYLENFWDTANDKAIPVDSWAGSPYRKEDWDCYQQLRNSSENPKRLTIYRDETSDCCWVEDGIQILAPTPELVDEANGAEDYNCLSYVLRVGHAGRSAVLGGDATKKVWGDILDHYEEEDIKADILLAPHHGSVRNFHKEAMEAMDPDYIVVSVAVGTDYAYDEYSSIGQVLSTKWRGNIVFSIDDWGNIEYSADYDR